MKVALLLTGFTRSHIQNFESVKRFVLERYKPDVYFATWNKTQSNVSSEILHSNSEKIIDLYKKYLKEYTIVDFDFYQQNRKNISFLDRNDDVFKVNKRAIEHGSFWVERLRDQWYLVNLAEKLVYGKYDVVIRLRFDIKLHQFELLEEEFVTPTPHPINPYTDHLAYGSQTVMRKYCSLYSYIEKLYADHNVDISFAELMLQYYMENVSPPVKVFVDQNIKYEIIK